MLTQRLRHRVTFEEQVEVTESSGEVIGHEWRVADVLGELLENVPAEVLTGPGREFEAADAKQSETTARINLRWFPGLLQSWRVLWEGKRYNISSIDTDVTARKEWRLRCEDGPTDGA
jgi:SPP1 family predicted phage head-tail adaptor